MKVRTLLAMAEGLVRDGNIPQAFTVLREAKALREPVEGVDILRARCFIEMRDLSSAAEALKEELRYFPQSGIARDQLSQVTLALSAAATAIPDDPDFKRMLEIIRPYTMLSVERLHSLYTLARRICTENRPGNFIECGVAGGGSTLLLALVIKQFSRRQRSLFSFDTFEGMPTPGELDTHAGVNAEATGWGSGTCAASQESIRALLEQHGVSPIVTLVKGLFQETLPRTRDWTGMLAFLHLDGDWYESTKAILDNLWDRLLDNALLQIDDYGHWEGCRRAVDEFALFRNITFDLKTIDGTGRWTEKPDRFPVNSMIAPDLLKEFSSIDAMSTKIESQMSANERFQLFTAVRTEIRSGLNPMVFIEIGSYAGASLVILAMTARLNGTPFAGFSVDPGGVPSLREVVKGLEPEVQQLRMYSHDARPILEEAFTRNNALASVILVDGDHTEEGVCRDIVDYYPLLAPGGLMIFHDFLPALDDKNQDAIFFHHGGKAPGIRAACLALMEKEYNAELVAIPLLHPTDATQTQAHLPVIPGVFSTLRVYRKPVGGRMNATV